MNLELQRFDIPPQFLNGFCESIDMQSFEKTQPLSQVFNAVTGAAALSGGCSDTASCGECTSRTADAAGALSSTYSIAAGTWAISCGAAGSGGGALGVTSDLPWSVSSNVVSASAEGTVEIATSIPFEVVQPGFILVQVAKLTECESQCNLTATATWDIGVAGDSLTTTSLPEPNSCCADDQYSGPAIVPIPAGSYTFTMSYSYSIGGELSLEGTCTCKGPCAQSRTLSGNSDLQLSLRYFIGNYCPGDVDGDGSVGASDLGGFLASYGTTRVGLPSSNYRPESDFDGDGTIGLADLNVLLGNYGASW